MPLKSAAEPEQQWPPRSPAEALRSTPSGREKLRRLAERASPSPSPSKRTVMSRAESRINHDDEDDDEMDLDDEDEEMLQLKLAAIQAKLKLKKLQSAKAKRAQDNNNETYATRPESRSIPEFAPPSRTQSRAEASGSGATSRPQSQVDVQVPASPVRRAQTAQEALSPSRIRLGIDKGLRAKDVSLKRAPSMKNPTGPEKGPHGGYIRRTNTPAPAPGATSQPAPAKTFSERLAAARSDETSRRERLERIQKVRTNAFQLGKQEMDDLKQHATDIPEVPRQEEQFSRDEVMAGRGLKRSTAIPGSKQQQTQSGNEESIASQPEEKVFTRKPKVEPSEMPEDEASAFEPYSSLHLSKRIIPHSTLTRNLSGKKTYVIPDLLKHVKAPEFQLPEVEQDIVVFGILASKSEPRAHKDTGSNVKEKLEAAAPTKPKYMVLTLVDLKWELELFLFNTGFERYWKLTPGTVLAILNPTIMPPPPNKTDTGRFSLVINSGHDTILEVGTARDLGFCKSVKRDGALCNSWVNAKRTEFCEFHMNLALSKKRLARQEVNAFDTGMGPRKQGSSHRLNNNKWGGDDNNKKQRGNYDRESQSAWFLHKASAVSKMDNEVLGGAHGRTAGTIERTEALRRRLATEEKERDIMKKLGELGSGAGKEYMQRSNKTGNGSEAQTQQQLDDERPKLSAKSLGLVSDRNAKIHLSPVKRKRAESALSGITRNTHPGSGSGSGGGPKVALGWGGNLTDKLARMKGGEKLDLDLEGGGVGGGGGGGGGRGDGSRSPLRKKTRFVTEKGIREAGRESLGLDLGSAGGGGGGGVRVKEGGGGKGLVFLDDYDDDDDYDVDDELVILK